MKTDILFEFYKEQYQCEIERKDNITTQIQVRFVIIATACSIIIYMLRTLDLDANKYPLIIFAISIVFSSIGLILATLKLIDAFEMNEYSYIPLLTEIEKYRKQTNDDNKVMDFLLVELSECTHDNAIQNDKRIMNRNRAMKIILFTSIPFFIACFVYVFTDLDSSSPRKATTVIIKKTESKTTYLNALGFNHE
ncbi:hypothetical protein [Photobacterium damselae]|uniref:hypothetical protein n=1 Tax=Photobacterium damselae TaxID=38293 RepID=UPI0010FD9565|nr:hypothetical protein [Photobacterium damselae]TLS65436.1 hypothetical protein FD718_20050 [Photobacterium damselae subsp. damselae]